jgi:hypothetical protein
MLACDTSTGRTATMTTAAAVLTLLAAFVPERQPPEVVGLQIHDLATLTDRDVRRLQGRRLL